MVLENLKGFTIPNSAIREGLNTVQWYGRNQTLRKNPPVIFDVAHNSEGILCFLDYYKSLKISGKSTLVGRRPAGPGRAGPQLENVFQHIICTETKGRSPMSADILYAHFSRGHSIEIIKDSQAAIRKGLKGLSKDGGMAIIGTHSFGPAVNKLFKISFDNV